MTMSRFFFSSSLSLSDGHLLFSCLFASAVQYVVKGTATTMRRSRRLGAKTKTIIFPPKKTSLVSLLVFLNLFFFSFIIMGEFKAEIAFAPYCCCCCCWGPQHHAHRGSGGLVREGKAELRVKVSSPPPPSCTPSDQFASI